MLHEITLCISIEKKIIEEQWQSKERRWSGSSPQSVVGMSEVRGNKERFLWAKWTVKKVHFFTEVHWVYYQFLIQEGGPWVLRVSHQEAVGCSARAQSCEELEDVELEPEVPLQRTVQCGWPCSCSKELSLVFWKSNAECLITRRPLVLIHHKHICSRTQHRENHNGDKTAAK